MIQSTTQPGNICTNLLFKNFSSPPLNFLSHFDSASWYSTTAADLFEYNPMHILLHFQKWGSRQTEVGQTQNAMDCAKIIRQCFFRGLWVASAGNGQFNTTLNESLQHYVGKEGERLVGLLGHQLLYNLGLCMKLDLLLKLQEASWIILRIQPSHLLVALLLLLKDQQFGLSPI